MENKEKKIKYQLNSLPEIFLTKKSSDYLIKIRVTVGNGVYEQISVSHNQVDLECTMGWNEASFQFKVPANEIYEILTKKPFHEITSVDLMKYDWELLETSNGNLTFNKVNGIDIEREDEIIQSLKGTIYEISEEEIEADNKYDLISNQMNSLYNVGDIDDSEYIFNSLFSLEFNDKDSGLFFINWNYHEELLNNANKAFAEKRYQQFLDLIFKYLEFEFSMPENVDFSSYLKSLNLSNKISNIIRDVSISYEFLKNYDKALIYIDHYIRAHPENDFGYGKKGDYLSNLGRIEEAIENLKIAIDLNLNNITVIIKCSDLLKEIGKISEAIDILKFGIIHNSDSSWLFQTLGHIYFDKEDWLNAMDSYEKALEIEDISAVTNRRLGSVYYELKKFEKAVTRLQNSQKLDNTFKDTFTYYFIGESLKNLNKFQEAIDQFLNCISLEVDNVHAFAYSSMGYCYLQLNDFKQCIEYSSKGLKNSWNLNNIGKAYFAIKNYSKALEYFNLTIELQANNKWAYHWKGDTLFELSQYSEALECYTKLLELDPKYTTYKDCSHISERIAYINNRSL